ncbi:Splicing factor 3B subunit 4 [Bonamia ostreae]|uniref:Splicing factor 3B subunit 4 n=1 Tax=Bonamia ostreae TaxID=126728 RepID=A0ABV2AMQ7_9EUKA
MLQAGPVMSVNFPRDKVTGTHQGFAFVEFRSEADADYAMKILNMIRLIGKTLKINKATREQGEQDIGANLFIGNLDPDVDEQVLLSRISAFVHDIQCFRTSCCCESNVRRDRRWFKRIWFRQF